MLVRALPLRNTRHRSLVATLLLSLLLTLAPFPSSVGTAQAASLELTAGKYVSQVIDSTSRGDSRATGTFETPSARPAYFGFQLRQSVSGSGYRAKLAVAADGSVRVSVARVESNRETALGSAPTGVTAASGEGLRLTAAVVGNSPVRIFVGLSTSAKPYSGWHLEFQDGASNRLTAAGSVSAVGYLSSSAGSSRFPLTYGSMSVSGYTASEATALEVKSTQSNGPSAAPPPAAAPPTSGFPTAGTTGVKPGSSITRHDGDITVTKDNTVLANLDIHGFVNVKAKNVIIRNSIVRGGKQKGFQVGLITNYGYSNLLIEDVDVVAAYPSVYFDGIKGWDFTARRVHVVGNVDSVKIHGDNVTIEDSLLENTVYYAKDPAQNGGPTHNDNVQILKGSNLKILRNTIRGATNFAILGGAEQGDVSLTVSDNYLDGGHCTLKLQVKNGRSQTAKVTGNSFGPNRIAKSCAFTSYPAVKLTESGNKLADGTVVKPLLLVS